MWLEYSLIGYIGTVILNHLKNIIKSLSATRIYFLQYEL